MDAELVRFILELAAAAICGAAASYFGSRRGVISALQNHGDRILVLETWRKATDDRVERVEDAVFVRH